MIKIKIMYNIQKIRAYKDIPLKQVSAITGISIAHLSDIEKGKKNPSVLTLCLIAIALDEEPCNLFEVFIL